MDIYGVFFSANIAVKLACYTGLIESLGMKIDKLSGTDFEAGIRSLEQAINSKSERVFLFRESRGNFNRAISLEKNERLVMSYIGLAFCHDQLEDKFNAINALEMVGLIEMQGKNIAIAKTVVSIHPLGQGLICLIDFKKTVNTHSFWNPMHPILNFSEKKRKLESLKKSVKTFLNSY